LECSRILAQKQRAMRRASSLAKDAAHRIARTVAVE